MEESKTPSRWGNVTAQIFVSIAANSISLINGCILSISSILLLQIQEVDGKRSLDGVISISQEKGSFFASIYSAGYIFGSLLGGLQSNTLGRRTSMIVDCIVVFIGILLISLGNSFPLILLGRYMGGHACGSAFVSLPAYNSEISHKSLRGLVSGMLVVFYYLGCLLVTVFGTYIPWRVAVGLCGIFPLASICGLSLCPESPVWLLHSGKEKEALQSLIFLNESQADAEEELSRIKESFEREILPNSTFTTKIKSVIKGLGDPSFRIPLLHLLVIICFIGTWSGVMCISIYLVPFMNRLNVPLDPYVAACLLSVYRLLLGIIALAGLVTLSRRLMLITSLLVMCLSTLSMALHQYLLLQGFLDSWGLGESNVITWIPVLCIIILYGATALGFAPSCRTLQGELLPSDKRSLGGSIIGLSEGVTMFIVNLVVPALMEVLETYGCFFIFALADAFGLLFVYLYLPDTKGKHLNEIHEHYRGVTTNKSEDEGD